MYELQLEGKVQRKGLGRFLMKMMELIAFQMGMQSIMLTVMQANASALSLYADLGYTQHPSCPSGDMQGSAGYLILHKPLPQKRVKH